MKEIIFWGATGQAKVLRDCIKESNLKVVALFDNNLNLTSPFKDIPLYFGKPGFEDWRAKINGKDGIKCLVAIGGRKGKDRIEIQEYLQSFGLIPIIAKHPSAFVSDGAQIGVGSQILAMSAVCVGASIGRGCIINTSATVDHECQIGDGVHISPGAHLAGCVEIGRYSTVGTGAIVLPRIKIGECAEVGAGTLVTNDVPSYTVVVGNPARVIREISREK